METADADRVDRGAHQFFLAASVGRELGARPVLSRATRRPGLVVSGRLSDRGAAGCLLADAPAVAALVPDPTAKIAFPVSSFRFPVGNSASVGPVFTLRQVYPPPPGLLESWTWRKFGKKS